MSRWKALIILITLLQGIFSFFYLRLHYMEMFSFSGMYQGDLWYFFTNYGNVIQHQWFYFIEYPVGYILIQKLMYFLTVTLFGTFTYEHFIYTHAFVMIPLMISLVLLVDHFSQLIQKRKHLSVWYLFLSPTFLIAASTNYDLFPISCLLFALFFLLKNKYSLSFFILSLGTIIKLFPGFLLPIFILYLLQQKVSLDKIIQSTFVFFITTIAINLPYIIGNLQMWLFPYQWQSQNPQRLDPNTIMFYLSQIGLEKFANIILFLFLAFSWSIAFIIYRQKKLNSTNFFWCCLLTIFSAVFANHVNTPQYLLWFLPFIAILQFPPLIFWWPFDLVNSSILYCYFRLVNQWKNIQFLIFTITILYFTSLYGLLLLHLKQFIHEKNS